MGDTMYQSENFVNQLLENWKHDDLKVHDVDKARHYIRRIGTYRIQQYAHPFRNPADRTKFKDGTDFESIFSLYKFDRNLRLLALDAIERIETSLKSDLEHHYCDRYGTIWYTNQAFHDSITNSGKNARMVRTIGSVNSNIQRKFALRSGKLPEITSYVTSNPSAPIEAMTFGQVVSLYDAADYAARTKIARSYQAREAHIFGKMLYRINTVRNMSAHHERLWNHPFKDEPVIPHIITDNFGSAEPQSNYHRKMYGSCLIIHFLLQDIARNTRWNHRLREIMQDIFFQIKTIDVHELMGFPTYWSAAPYWSETPFWRHAKNGIKSGSK
jgi:abortive infection bacteriophage resistance protein